MPHIDETRPVLTRKARRILLGIILFSSLLVASGTLSSLPVLVHGAVLLFGAIAASILVCAHMDIWEVSPGATALGIADGAMAATLVRCGVGLTPEYTRIGLADSIGREVSTLSAASPAIVEAYEWLHSRGFAALERDDVGEIITLSSAVAETGCRLVMSDGSSSAEAAEPVDEPLGWDSTGNTTDTVPPGAPQRDDA